VEQQMSAMLPPPTTPLESVSGLGEGLIEKLGAAGITTVEALADMTPEQLEAIEGIGPKTVEKISLAVNNYFSSLEGGEPEAGAEAAVEGEVAPAEDSASLEASAETSSDVAGAEVETPEASPVEETLVEENAAAEGASEPAASSDDVPSATVSSEDKDKG